MLRPGQNKITTQTQKSRKTQKQVADSGEGGQRRWTAALVGHTPSLEPPRRRFDAIELVAIMHGLKKAKRDPHAHLGAENSQVCGRHVPITDDRHDWSLRRQGRRTTGNAAGGACQSEVGGEV
jgi:hypothetical protein